MKTVNQNGKIVLKIAATELRVSSGRLVTHCMEILSAMKPIFDDKMLDLRSLPDGMAGFFRYKDGNAYEVTVKPAKYSNPELFGHLTKQKP